MDASALEIRQRRTYDLSRVEISIGSCCRKKNAAIQAYRFLFSFMDSRSELRHEVRKQICNWEPETAFARPERASRVASAAQRQYDLEDVDPKVEELVADCIEGR